MLNGRSTQKRLKTLHECEKKMRVKRFIFNMLPAASAPYFGKKLLGFLGGEPMFEENRKTRDYAGKY